MAARFQKIWTKEEKEFLEESIGLYAFPYIAKQLNRTPRAVEREAERLGISNTMDMGGWLSCRQAAKAIGVGDKTLVRWFKNKNFPFKTNRLRHYKNYRTKNEFYRLLPEDFWKWAVHHKDLVDFSKVDPDMLVPVPDWFEQERRRCEQQPAKRKIWEPEEEQQVWEMFYQKAMSQYDIALHFNCSRNAIERKLNRLRAKKLEATT